MESDSNAKMNALNQINYRYFYSEKGKRAHNVDSSPFGKTAVELCQTK